ncbi:Copine family protein 2 [Lamellibrachia satsuma]|nr:Copine family protein 2 [Lamellibrachia satsuma]
MDLVALAVILIGLIIAIQVVHSYFFRPQNKLCPKPAVFFPRTNALLNWYNVKHVNAIVDQFKSVQEVGEALQAAGLGTCHLMFGVDFSASNAYQGERTFDGQNLHTIEDERENPYQRVIRIMGQTLEQLDTDSIIPAFGFGDASTKAKTVFPFRKEGYCCGYKDVLEAYSQIIPNIVLSGPTNFAPLIHRAVHIVCSTRKFHILVIIVDGQATLEKETCVAIAKASRCPLSIVMVGVGDGPWQMMESFHKQLPCRQFDNFRFVDFNRVITYGAQAEATFAVHALLDVLDQYNTVRGLGLLNQQLMW